MHRLSVAETISGLRTRQFSALEVAEHLIARAKNLAPMLNAIVSLTEEQAIVQARAADERLAGGDAHALTGVPLLHKDIFCTQGVKTSCGSRFLDNFVPPYDATVVQRFKSASTVLLGKTNMDEFAMGSSTENSFFGPTRNPWDVERVPGGSSGGSAAAVAAGLAPLATATDTGGSIRQPASFCGVTGLKPTYGRVSRFGMVAFASSLDQGGLMARSAEDIALTLGQIAGLDPRDSTSAQAEVDDYAAELDRDLKGLRIGVLKQYLGAGVDPTVGTLIQDAVRVLEGLGASVHEIELKYAALSIPTYYVIALAECSSNLSRFDGVRYGRRADKPANLEDLYERSRGEGFGAEVKRRIMLGTYALSAGYYDAYYLKAQRCRRLVAEDFQRALSEVDVLVGPNSPTPAFRLGEKVDDPVTMYLSDVNTVAVNLAGLPGLSMPAGFADGLPVGMQLIGDYFAEGRLLNVAHRFQQVTDWHLRRPEGI